MQNENAIKGKQAHSIIQNALLTGEWAEVADVSKGDVKKELSIFEGKLTTEKRVSFDIGEDHVSGFIDLHYESTKEINVVDMKPGFSNSVSIEETLQTSFYGLNELNPFKPVITWIFRYQTAKLLKVEYLDINDTDRLQIKIKRLINEKKGILDKELYRCRTVAGDSCLFCPYPLSCKEGKDLVNVNIDEMVGELLKLNAKRNTLTKRRDAFIDLKGEVVACGSKYFRNQETGKINTVKIKGE